MQLDILLRHASVSAPRLPALERLLAVAKRATFSGGADVWACRTFGVKQQQDFPIAPFAAKQDGLDTADAYWLCATPVNLQVTRDRIALAEDTLNLSMDEAQALKSSLTRHFTELDFFVPHPQRWYLRLKEPPAITTTLLEQAFRRDVSGLMPLGSDAKIWRRAINELQMLMHAHPVNEAREHAGKLTANSLWLWGGGVMATAISPYATVLSEDVFVSSLAGRGAKPLPTSWKELSAESTLVVLDAQSGWEALEERWFANVLHALQTGQTHGVRVCLAEEDKVHVFSIKRRDLWKLWRRTKPLADYLNTPLS
ncbi:MAG: hypothetical protein K8Q92_05645 [Methylophilales bacterium]|nr:hypothetical protein [Methylophilales bacterium]